MEKEQRVALSVGFGLYTRAKCQSALLVEDTNYGNNTYDQIRFKLPALISDEFFDLSIQTFWILRHGHDPLAENDVDTELCESFSDYNATESAVLSQDDGRKKHLWATH